MEPDLFNLITLETSKVQRQVVEGRPPRPFGRDAEIERSKSLADQRVQQLEVLAVIGLFNGFEQEHCELPDLDTKAMATVARLNRTMGLLRRRIERHMEDNDSTLAEFDVLSTLRRSGSPHQMKPSTIARATMLSPSDMTHRIDQLEAAQLVERVPDPNSRRTAPVGLTELGQDKAERLARSLADVEEQSLQALTNNERDQLDKLLAKLAGGFATSDD